MNKQNITFSITKGSLLLIFQFCIHLMNLYIFKAFLPPGSAKLENVQVHEVNT